MSINPPRKVTKTETVIRTVSLHSELLIALVALMLGYALGKF